MLENEPPRGLGERLLSLRAFSLLASLPASELALVARLSRERDFQIGETLSVEGRTVHAVQLVLSGRGAVTRGGHAVEMSGPFDTVGLLSLAAGVPHVVTTVAVTPIHALELDADFVDEVLEDDFPLFARVLRMAAEAVRARRVGASGAGGVVGGWVLKARTAEQARDPSRPPSEEDLVRELRGATGAARRLLLLRDAPLFRSAPVDGLAAFAKRMELLRIPAGEHVETSEVPGEMSIVVSGQAEVTVRGRPFNDPPDVVEVAAGDVLGGLEALSGTPLPLVVRARSEVHLLRGSVAELLDVIEDHHAMGRRLIAEILVLDPNAS